ncbi:hypothetical protein OAG24_00650 [bacterium]|nr:hypothetical protein [bacterium]
MKIDTAHNIFFISSISTGIILFLFSAYSYDRFGKLERRGSGEAKAPKTISLVTLVISVLVVVLVVYSKYASRR